MFCLNSGHSKSGVASSNVTAQNTTTPNFNNSSNQTPMVKKSVLSVVSAALAFIGCFLPFIEISSMFINKSISFIDIKNALDTLMGGVNSFGSYFGVKSVPMEYQIIGAIPMIFLVICILTIVLSFIGSRVVSRMLSLGNIIILAGILFAPVFQDRCLAQLFSKGIEPGIGLILMCIGSIGMLVLP